MLHLTTAADIILLQETKNDKADKQMHGVYAYFVLVLYKTLKLLTFSVQDLNCLHYCSNEDSSHPSRPESFFSIFQKHLHGTI